jgi:hypothetical protein
VKYAEHFGLLKQRNTKYLMNMLNIAGIDLESKKPSVNALPGDYDPKKMLPFVEELGDKPHTPEVLEPLLIKYELVKIPSFRTLETNIESLSDRGFLEVRAVEKGKRKSLITLHPAFNWLLKKNKHAA